jgi:hypothetical protein
MIIQNISSLSRLLGLGVCLLSTWLSAWGSVILLAVAPQMSVWESSLAFVLLGLAAWSISSLGDWLWSFEEGWFGLQRGLRVVQAALIGGGMLCAVAFRIAHFYRIV